MTIRIAIQKSGRLFERSMDLLSRAGLDFDLGKRTLVHQALRFPAELMLVRDDDIPQYVENGTCALGIVGENLLAEHPGSTQALVPLGFGRCRLSIAVSETSGINSTQGLNGKRIATSYPQSLKAYADREGFACEVITLSGSVEIAPTLGIAEAACDLVSTGATLKANGLRELATVYESQATLVRTDKPLSPENEAAISRLTRRIEGVLRARNAKYIMMNAPQESLAKIRDILPGMEAPTVIPLHGHESRVAIHAVAREDIFWETMEQLKAAGADSILVSPIEKII